MNTDERLYQAYLDEMHLITILLPLSYHNGFSSQFTLSSGLWKLPLAINEIMLIEHYLKYTCFVNEEISFEQTYWIMDEHGGKTDLQIGAVIRTELFDQKFFYNGADLGVKVENGVTSFKLWAPTATQAKIKLRSPHGTPDEFASMIRDAKGIWKLEMCRDLEYYQYSFLVFVNLEWGEAVDPYARAVTPNGEMGVIIHTEKTKKLRSALPPLEHPVEAIIYETHIRDFTIHPDSGIQHKGLYLGAAETNTTGKDRQLTGLSYLKELGITHIEFLPFFDFAGVDEVENNGEYNWGYNPLNFNVPEGSYCTNPADPYARIVELKQLISRIHQEGLRVIMDVVYNHVYIRELSSFEKLVPGYYFRHNEYGYPSNGTGVGNDIASERLMVRKFILDSIRYWLLEYGIDGFRFDLMGILDIQTMNEARKLADRMAEGILLLGEGWNLPTPLPPAEKANLQNQEKMPSVAQFNDWFRDSIKGSTFHLEDKGFALGNEQYFEDAKEVITGSIGLFDPAKRLFNEPFQSVNYVECHDNHTLWDKLSMCFPEENEFLLMKYHRLATSIVLLSQGIPFLHSGQEFLRTKYGIGNSFQSSDFINQLDWSQKTKYSENVAYIKGMIEMRKRFLCFRFKTAEEIRRYIQEWPLPKPVLGISYRNVSEEFNQLILVVNPCLTAQTIPLPQGEWVLLADGKSPALSFPITNPSLAVIEPISLYIFAKK